MFTIQINTKYLSECTTSFEDLFKDQVMVYIKVQVWVKVYVEI